MTVHLKIKDKVINYDVVEEWKIVSLFGLFGGRSGYGLNVYFSGDRKGTAAWSRVAERAEKKEVEALLLSILDSVTEASAKGGGIITVP